ncbi:MAG: hypothetical protein KatS3mg039_0536 [Candidatus Kapaibacterium sp.]|nr:MAG: hypothetical protein KatS3mg039_0536 [Candidatus Kapabacteria bacterium]
MIRSAIIAIGIFSLVLCTLPLPAQKQDSLVVLRDTFARPFPIVWRAVKQLIEEQHCGIESEKQSFDEQTEMYRGNIRSAPCVLASGEDSTYDVLKRYGRVPIIRGGVWTSGRIQYNFSLRDLPDRKVQVVLTAELSGYEAYVTHLSHAWNANGILERQMMDRLRQLLTKPKEPSDGSP